MGPLFWALPTIFLVYNLYRAYNLFCNYLIARRIGVPVIIIPVGWQDDWWLLSIDSLRWIERLPSIFSYWYKLSHFAWAQEHRYNPHHKYGDAFVICSPAGIELMINDPDATVEISAQHKAWLKPQPVYLVFDIYGPTVLSVNGEEWQRHRRITNPSFRESNNNLVWAESLKQARQMLDARINQHQSKATVDEFRKDSVLIALHVLSAAGFGHSYDFSGGLRQVPEGHKQSFSDALMSLLTNILPLAIFSNIKAPKWLLPAKITRLLETKEDFRLYLKETIAYNRATTQGGGGGQSADLVSALVEADEAAKREQKNTNAYGGKPMHLTDDELNGNLFIFNLAGFETTANALTYTFPYLARSPQVQEWVSEEIDAVMQASSGDGDLDYETAFPQLIRCLAVMYETVRLWGPVPSGTRWPANSGQMIRIKDKDLFIPQGVFASLNIYGVHSDPRWWGPDSLEWKPQRWIQIDPKTGRESINPAPAGFPFLGWNHGPRICPGKKFSQVEFVAIIATILRSYHVVPMQIQGKHKTPEQARDALLKVVEDSENSITPKMRRPGDAGIIFVKRPGQG